jgi:hypothetical protein
VLLKTLVGKGYHQNAFLLPYGIEYPGIDEECRDVLVFILIASRHFDLGFGHIHNEREIVQRELFSIS